MTSLSISLVRHGWPQQRARGADVQSRASTLRRTAEPKLFSRSVFLYHMFNQLQRQHQSPRALGRQSLLCPHRQKWRPDWLFHGVVHVEFGMGVHVEIYAFFFPSLSRGYWIWSACCCKQLHIFKVQMSHQISTALVKITRMKIQLNHQTRWKYLSDDSKNQDWTTFLLKRIPVIWRPCH